MVASDKAMIELSSFVASVTLRQVVSLTAPAPCSRDPYMSWLGFFFFFRMAVAVSFSYNLVRALYRAAS
jgi:hypothetical protein